MFGERAVELNHNKNCPLLLYSGTRLCFFCFGRLILKANEKGMESELVALHATELPLSRLSSQLFFIHHSRWLFIRAVT